MDKFGWIRDVVAADRQMLEAGIVDLTAGADPECQLEDATVDFLQDLKLEFLKVVSAFNHLSGSSFGPIRVYAVAKTKADFVLFRNGIKLIFCMRNGGAIAVLYQGSVTGLEAGSQHLLTAEARAFGQLHWTYEGHPFQVEYLIRFYLSQFVRASMDARAVYSHEMEER